MAFTAADIEDFIAYLREDDAARRRVRDVLIADALMASAALQEQIQADLAALAASARAHESRSQRVDAHLAAHDARFDAVDAHLAAHDARFDAVDAHLAAHDARFDAVDARFDAVDARFDAVEGRLENVKGRLEKVEGRLGKVEGQLGNLNGSDYERRYVDSLPGRLARTFGRVVRIRADHRELLTAFDEGRISDEDWDDLHRSDALATARPRGEPHAPVRYVAVEISSVVDATDVARANRRAAILQRAGFDAVACVAGQRILDAAMDAALRLGVTVVQDLLADEIAS